MAALCAATAIIAVVVPFAAGVSLLGTVPMGLLAYRYRFRVLIAATVAGAVDRFSDRRHGRIHDGRQLRLHRRADRHRQAARPRHPDRVRSQRSSPGRLFGAAARGGAGDPGPAAPPDLRIDDRQRQRRSPRCIASHSRHGARRRAAQERLRHRAALLAVPVLRLVGALHHHRHVHRLVGAVAGDGPPARDSRRPQAGSSDRRRTGRPRAGAAARRPVPLSRRPTTTRSARCR